MIMTVQFDSYSQVLIGLLKSKSRQWHFLDDKEYSHEEMVAVLGSDKSKMEAMAHDIVEICEENLSEIRPLSQEGALVHGSLDHEAFDLSAHYMSKYDLYDLDES